MEARIAELATQALGGRVEAVEWLAGQLGARRFARVHLVGARVESAVARVDAPEDPAIRPRGVAPEPPLEPIRALLAAAGLPVPARHAADEAAGVELLEDVGDLTLADAARASGARRALYQEACDLVPRIQRVEPADVAAFDRHLDAGLIAYKADLFIEHAFGLRARTASAAEAETVRSAFARIASQLAPAPQRLAHRDFQSANLHVRAGRPAGERLVMIDLQGALLAPPEYDLVCLLRDSYLELAPEEVAHQLARIRPQLPDAPAADELALRFDLLTLTRKGKDLARFLQASERGDRRFLRFVPATLRTLRSAAPRAAARDRALAGLAELIDTLPESACGE